MRKSLKSSSGDVKALYKKLHRLLGKSEQSLPNSDKADQLAEDFKNFFSSKVDKIRDSIAEERDVIDKPTLTCDYEIPSSERPGEEFGNFKIPSFEEIATYVSNLSNKFCSLDPIPTFLLKECVKELLPILHHIVTESLLRPSEDPQELKKAVVKPVLKKDTLDADCLKNYRPVSNLSVVSKLIEKIVLDQLNTHIENNNLHSSMQSGYRVHHSCETLLVK